MKLKIVASLLIAGGLTAPAAYATDGYLPLGYGIKNEAMGGASIALPLDSIAAANNPAGMVLVGDRVDFGLTWFKPDRSSTLAGGNCPALLQGASCSNTPNYTSTFPYIDGTYDGNGRSNFFVPQFGYNRMMDANTSIGVSVFGNGGMNTQYNTSPFAAYGGGTFGINLAQLFVAPTWATKINENNAVGVSLNLAYQMFSATGLQPFAGFSSNQNSFSNNGTDAATGYGIRLGWTGQVSPTVTLGATYQSKTKMGSFSKYSGLFQSQGNFDIPANYGVGIAVKATPVTTVAFDVEHVDYGGVPTINNSYTLMLPPAFGGQGLQLGSTNGPGFGWQSINTYKLGMSYAYDPSLTLRAGLNHCDQPIPNKEAFLNMLAPGIVQDHLSLGATWKLANKSELSVAYIHAFKKTVTGPGMGPTATSSLTMSEDSIGVAYGW
jgi:long-chain fatty acid transport protein